MKIYIAPYNSPQANRQEMLKEIIKLAKDKIYRFTEDPEEADIILVAETACCYEQQWRLLNKYLNKCYAFGVTHQICFAIPGLYTNAPRSLLDKHLYKGCSYMFRREKSRNAFLNFHNGKIDKAYLFSFMGSSTSLTRKRLLKLKFNRNDILIRCTNNYNDWKLDPNREFMQKTYIDTIQSSKFVICPRGSGWGIIRIFEAMELGVAPVIISDKWLPPMGPDWNSFALFVKQSDIKNLVEIVESHATEYEERGRLARKAWEEYFSDPVVFNQCMEAVKDLKANRIAILDRFIFYSYPLILGIDQFKTNCQKSIKFIILKLFNFLKLQFPYELVNK